MAARNALKNIVKRQTLVLLILVIGAIFTLFNPRFLRIENLLNILRQISVNGIMACGLTFVLISGNFDLSGGAVVSLTCCTMVLMHDQFGPIPAMFFSMLIGIGIGSVTGFLVGYVKLNNFITTLGIQSIVNAVSYIYTNSRYYAIRSGDTWIDYVGRGSFCGLPVQFYVYMALLVIFQVILSKTLFGYQVKAVGGNAQASRYTGIRDGKIVATSYAIAGLCYGIAGVVLACRSLTSQVESASGFEFEVITACILSGNSLQGGEGSVSKAFLGVFIMGMLKNGYVMVGIPAYYQYLTQCIIILTVVWVDMRLRKRVER